MSKRDTDYVPYSEVHKLKVLRQMLGITQEKCAQVLGFERNRYSCFELGNDKMPRKHFEAVYDFLHGECVKRYNAGGIPRTNITRLNYLLHDNGLTIQQVASMVKINYWDLSHMRRGKKPLPDELMQRIEQAVKAYRKEMMSL